jgi:hypothetical protein
MTPITMADISRATKQAAGEGVAWTPDKGWHNATGQERRQLQEQAANRILKRA